MQDYCHRSVRLGLGDDGDRRVLWEQVDSGLRYPAALALEHILPTGYLHPVDAVVHVAVPLVLLLYAAHFVIDVEVVRVLHGGAYAN